MTKKQAKAEPVYDPVTGEEMVLESVLDPDVIRRQHAELRHNPAASARFIEQLMQKNEELGPIYRNPRTGYMMRVKPGGEGRAS